MSSFKAYVFNSPVTGQMNLDNCNVVINDRAGQVILKNCTLVNNGSLGMTINMTGANAEYNGYRERVVEKKVFITDPKLMKEVEYLRSQNKSLRKENQELREGLDSKAERAKQKAEKKTENALEEIQRMQALIKNQREEYRKQIETLKDNLTHLKRCNDAALEVNGEMARRIQDLERKKTKVVSIFDFDPREEDIRDITKNIGLFLDDDEIEFYGLNKEV